jgi:hypothetical protein
MTNFTRNLTERDSQIEKGKDHIHQSAFTKNAIASLGTETLSHGICRDVIPDREFTWT